MTACESKLFEVRLRGRIACLLGQGIGKGHRFGTTLFCLEPRRTCEQAVQRFGDDRKSGLGDGVIEAHHDVTRFDNVAVPHTQFAHHTTGRMLDLLYV